MASNRTLTYTIKLLSNIAQQANQDAQALENGNRRTAASYRNMARDIERSSQMTRSSLNRMGEGVGARLARQFDMGLAKLKQMRTLAEKPLKVASALAQGATTGAMAGAAAGVAATHILKPQVDFDRRIGLMANTAFGDKSAPERVAGKQTLVSIVDDATKRGGGTRESAAEALNAMLASGRFEGDKGMTDLKSLMPTIVQAATGSGSSPEEIANIAISAMQNNGLQANQIEAVLGKAIKGGQLGQFELKDMAAWLPKLMANAGKSMQGMEGIESLIANAQVARVTAGSSDEAGNNLANLLKKVTSADTKKDFKNQGIDLDAELLKGRSQGKDTLQTFAGLADRVVQDNPAYKTLQAKAAASKDDGEKARMYSEMAGILENSGIGKIIQDQEALKALVAIMNNQQRVDEIKGKLQNERGQEVLNSYGTVSTDAKSGFDKTGNAYDSAVGSALEVLTPRINEAADAFSRFAGDHPEATGFGALAVGSGAAAGGAWWLTNKLKANKAGGAMPSEPATSAQNANTPTVTTREAAPAPRRSGMGYNYGSAHREPPPPPSRWQRTADTLNDNYHGNRGASRIAGRVGGIAAAGMAVYEGYKVLSSDASAGQKAQGLSQAAGSGLGGWGGAAMGAAIGTAILPGIGTAIGGLIGGIAGSMAGSSAGNAVGDMARQAIDGPAVTSAVQAGVTQGLAQMPSVMQPPAYQNTPLLNQTPPPPQDVNLSIKDGKLQVAVQVNASSSLIEATARANQPFIPLQLAGSGSTDPGGYGGKR